MPSGDGDFFHLVEIVYRILPDITAGCTRLRCQTCQLPQKLPARTPNQHGRGRGLIIGLDKRSTQEEQVSKVLPVATDSNPGGISHPCRWSYCGLFAPRQRDTEPPF